MPTTHARINPTTIVVFRDTRQRQENIGDIEDLKLSIKEVGVIEPLILRMKDGKPTLIAGERRLKAVLELGIPEVDTIIHDELDDEGAEIIELEENLKRKELPWRDQVRSTGRIHALGKKREATWTIEQTAARISLHPTYVRRILHVFASINDPKIAKADSIDQAFNTIHKFAERKAEAIVGDIIVKGAAAFGGNASASASAAIIQEVKTTDTSLTMVSSVAVAAEDIIEPPPAPVAPAANVVALPAAAAIAPPMPIICANFHEWAKTYVGPKFSLIHCDFPYGNYKGGDSKGAMNGLESDDFYDNREEIYWQLLESLTANLDRIMSYSAHLVFWFQMGFYTETVLRLRKTGLLVHDHPLIWHKTGGPGGLGVAPGTDATHPRRTYDTALLASRGGRPLVRSMCNSYAAPTVGNKIHPSQKPEPMLRYFLQMVVDETTSMLDPTCGSAAALRAAEDLGARSVLGLELDPNYVDSANTRTIQSRILRRAGTFRSEEALA